MNPQSQGTTSSSPVDPPLKRKRGRPRKDENMPQGENMPATPAADSMKKDKQSAGITGGAVGDEMVGKVVSGVIEGSFDAGYLLKVKVGDTETHLRGVVFLPGRFTPITASNDVAPEAKMYRRTEMPIPVPIPPQTHFPRPVPSPEHIDKQPVEIQDLAPKNQVKGLPSELQSSVQIAQADRHSSDMLPLVNNLPPISSTGSSLGSGVAPQQILESVTGSQFASIMPQKGHEKVTEQNDMLKEFEASVKKFPDVIVEATEQKKAMPQSALPVNSVPGSGNFELKVQLQVASNDFKPNQVSDGVKIQNLDHNQVPAITEPGMMSAEPIGTKVWTEKVPELNAKTMSGNNTSNLNGSPASHAANVTEAESQSAPSTGLPVTLFEREAVPSEPKLATDRSPLQKMIQPQICSNDPNIIKADSNSVPVASLPVTLFEREAVPPERKHAIDGPVLPRLTESQFCISPGVSNNVDCNLKDAIPPTES